MGGCFAPCLVWGALPLGVGHLLKLWRGVSSMRFMMFFSSTRVKGICSLFLMPMALHSICNYPKEHTLFHQALQLLLWRKWQAHHGQDADYKGSFDQFRSSIACAGELRRWLFLLALSLILLDLLMLLFQGMWLASPTIVTSAPMISPSSSALAATTVSKCLLFSKGQCSEDSNKEIAECQPRYCKCWWFWTCPLDRVWPLVMPCLSLVPLPKLSASSKLIAMATKLFAKDLHTAACKVRC